MGGECPVKIPWNVRKSTVGTARGWLCAHLVVRRMSRADLLLHNPTRKAEVDRFLPMSYILLSALVRHKSSPLRYVKFPSTRWVLRSAHSRHTQNQEIDST